MQVVPGVSCAAVAPVPARARAAGRAPRVTRARKPLELTCWEDERLSNKIYRVVCSEPWYSHCKALITSGKVAYKDAQAKELRRTGVYPPGGVMTRMEQCGCGHWCPPARYVRERRVDDVKDEKGKPTGQVKVTYTAWLPVCLDCFYAAMPLFDAVRVPSSPGSTTRIKDKELPAHLEGSGFGRRSKRRRFVADGGVCEEVVLEGGETYDLVVVPPPREAPDAPGGGDESAGKGNECMPS